MSVKRIESKDSNKLIYRQVSSYASAASAGIVAVLVLHGTVWKMIADWPNDRWSYAAGAAFCLLTIIWAMRKTVRNEIVLNRKSGHAQVSLRWLWRIMQKDVDISTATGVLRCVSRPIESPDSHWVAIRTSDGKELHLFNGPRYDELLSDAADNIAQEIGAHLHLPVLRLENGVNVTNADGPLSTADCGESGSRECLACLAPGPHTTAASGSAPGGSGGD